MKCQRRHFSCKVLVPPLQQSFPYASFYVPVPVSCAALAMKRQWQHFRRGKDLPTDKPNLVAPATAHVSSSDRDCSNTCMHRTVTVVSLLDCHTVLLFHIVLQRNIVPVCHTVLLCHIVHCCTDVLLHCCPAALLYAALLYCCTDILLY